MQLENKLILQAKVVRKEMKTSGKGNKFMKLRLEWEGDRGDKLWINATAFGNEAINIDSMTGEYIELLAKVVTNSWTDKDNQKRFANDLVVIKATQFGASSTPADEPYSNAPGPDEDLPF